MSQAQSVSSMMQGAFVPIDAANGVYAMMISGPTTGNQGLPIETSIPFAARTNSITDTSTAPVAAPGAGAAICTTAALPGGTYEVEVNSMITGTTADADLANMRLLVGATPVTRILNPGGAVVTKTQVRIDTAGGAASIIAVAAATAGSKYWAQIIASRIN